MRLTDRHAFLAYGCSPLRRPQPALRTYKLRINALIVSAKELCLVAKSLSSIILVLRTSIPKRTRYPPLILKLELR